MVSPQARCKKIPAPCETRVGNFSSLCTATARSAWRAVGAAVPIVTVTVMVNVPQGVGGLIVTIAEPDFVTSA